MSHTLEINIMDDNFEEFEVEVTYSVTGRYRAATYFEPAEHPELEVEDITFMGASFNPEWLETKMDFIEAECWEHYDSLCEESILP